jgi:hypothetical protein
MLFVWYHSCFLLLLWESNHRLVKNQWWVVCGRTLSTPCQCSCMSHQMA